MKKSTQKLTLSILTLTMIFSFTEVKSQKYIVDSGHTSFQTEVMRFGVVPVVGRFNEVSGEINFDPENIESTQANLLIKTTSYFANNSAGEKAITSAAFLDVANYPEINFRLASLKKTDGGYQALGEIEIHGTKKEITVPVQINGPAVDLPTRKQSIGITGSLTIDRTEFGVGKTMQLPDGRVIVSNDVKIDFVILGLAE